MCVRTMCETVYYALSVYLHVCCGSLSSRVPFFWLRPSRLTEESGPGSQTSGGVGGGRGEGAWAGEGSSQHSPSRGAGGQRPYHPDRSLGQATDIDSKAQRPVGRTVANMSRQVCRVRHASSTAP